MAETLKISHVRCPPAGAMAAGVQLSGRFQRKKDDGRGC